MPSRSAAQARLMAAAAHNPKIAEKTGVPVSVAQEFNAADTESGILKRAMKHGDNQASKQAPAR